ncbi:TPR Domain containing protein [Tritrichomonas foetus]|uniref:TPR Domain containing protein n=1 Tax=Tritrichomonas foetus TaxID=1144522 RepID=A0A1J4JVN8_9EUKA|nr:TPR Domain containing protein [Tritrichomonas foetus]|eukprot:OHT02496.1 TPR Domain containing protein [Tritrichomonas foetus]
MNPPDQLTPLMKLGLFRSVDMLSSFVPHPSTRVLITRARALTELRKYHTAVKILDTIDRNARTEEEMNEIIELRFTCYLNMSNAASKCAALLPHLVNRVLTPKLHVLAAKAYILQDASHSPNHPAIHHLMEVLKIYPMAIELVEDLLFVGAPINDIMALIPPGMAKVYIQSLQYSANSEFKKAIECFTENLTNNISLPICVLNQICLNAWESNQMTLFDSTASLIPNDELDIVDLRAARFKTLRKIDELNQLVSYALNSDENNANAWLAFSHLLEFSGDHQRALQSTRKALLLDRNSRRGFMRHGELRIRRTDYKKALTAFTKAHQIHEGIDSFRELVLCHCQLEEFSTAESFAIKALHLYPYESEHGTVSLTLLGIALRNRDPQRAVEILKKALEKAPDYADALTALIDMKLKDEDFDGAERILREFREQQQDFYYFMKLGEIYGYKREFTKAIEYVNTASRIDPANERARELLDQLESMIRENDSDFETEEEGLSF